MKKGTFLMAVVFASAFAAPSALALRTDSTRAMIVQEMNAGMKRIAGELVCQMAEANDGSACVLKLQANGGDAIYRLGNTAKAMELYNAGTKKVAATGVFADGNVFEISQIQAE